MGKPQEVEFAKRLLQEMKDVAVDVAVCRRLSDEQHLQKTDTVRQKNEAGHAVKKKKAVREKNTVPFHPLHS